MLSSLQTITESTGVKDCLLHAVNVKLYTRFHVYCCVLCRSHSFVFPKSVPKHVKIHGSAVVLHDVMDLYPSKCSFILLLSDAYISILTGFSKIHTQLPSQSKNSIKMDFHNFVKQHIIITHIEYIPIYCVSLTVLFCEMICLWRRASF
jgi:hypothetical protein